MSKSSNQSEKESRVRIAKLHQEVKGALEANPELSAIDKMLSGELGANGKYKVGLSEEQYDQLHSEISDLAPAAATKSVVNEISFGLQKFLMQNHLVEANSRPLAVLENEIIKLGKQKSELVRNNPKNTKKIKAIEKEFFIKALKLSSFPINEGSSERNQAESSIKHSIRFSINKEYGINVDSRKFSAPSDAMVRGNRFPNASKIIEECIAEEGIREDNLDTSIPRLNSRLESAFETELMVQSAVSTLIEDRGLDITPKQYSEIASTFRQSMMGVDPKYIREHQGAITLEITNTLQDKMSGKKIKQQDFTEVSDNLAKKYNLAKEEDLLKDLKQFRGYFDLTIKQMKAKALAKGIEVDFTQYEELQEQWHNLCDDALASFDKTSGAKMTQQNINDIVNAMGQMNRGVNREHINSYLKKPEYYLERWQSLIPEKGKKLVDVSANVAFEQDLALQRMSAAEIGEYTRVTRLRHVMGSMVKDYPDLQKIEDKLSKGHNAKRGKYDIGLSLDQYMELYESCQKIKDGRVNAPEEVASMRSSINSTLPLSRRIKSAFSRKSKKGRIDPDSDISPESLSNEDMEQISEVLEEVTSQNKSTHQKMMSEIARAGGVPSRAKENSAVRREVEKVVKNSESPSSNPIVLELEAREQEKATGVKRIEGPKEVIEQSPVQKQLAVVLYDNLEEEQEVSTTKNLDLVQQSSARDDTSHKKLMSEIREAAGKPKKKSEVKPKTKTHTEPEAHDSVVFLDGSGSEGRSSKVHSTNVHRPEVNVKVSDAVDPITQAIRDEIITRQQLYLQQELAKEMRGSERANLLDQDLPGFRNFIATEEGKELLESATSKPQVQEQLHTMEKAGYKAVHSKFSDKFHDVDWQAKAGKVRATEVKNGDGEHVCTLSETTFDLQPQNVALSDGTGRVIRSYRQIDFPKELETGNGPVHFSMAVKDENGKNISEKEAVYFTAHYDESGKLEEVSSPVPVKFMGKEDDAIGYIERNGKVYTLPVTQGKYKEMMKEVAKNNGMNVDVSQSVEKEELASDMVITNSGDVPEKLAQKVKKIGGDLEATKTKTTGHVATPLAKTKSDVGKSNTR